MEEDLEAGLEPIEAAARTAYEYWQAHFFTPDAVSAPDIPWEQLSDALRTSWMAMIAKTLEQYWTARDVAEERAGLRSS